ncbi:MAG: diguanylate cyclase [Pseudomonadota bacterium]
MNAGHTTPGTPGAGALAQTPLVTTPPPAAVPAPLRPALHHVLRRALLILVVLAVTVAGTLLTGISMVALRANAAENLHLVARSIGYTVEAAVVFRDKGATLDALSLIAEGEDVAEAEVFDHDKKPMATWQREVSSPWQRVERWAARALLPPPVTTTIQHDGQDIGQVRVRGAGRGLVLFLMSGIGAILACLLLSALVALGLMQRVLANILSPIQELAQVARAAQRERSLDRRVPPAEIAEFHELGEDVNALLTELEARQAEMTRENAHLAHRATHDSLTGLPNRASFEARLARAIPAAATSGAHVAVLFLDGDRFKQINDTLGHAAGDAVLVAIAQRVKAQLRDRDLVARLGGDEFAVLLDSLHDAADAERVANAIEAAMAEPILLPEGGTLTTSVSIGLAVYPDQADDAETLVAAADAAMYRTKRLRPQAPRHPASDSAPSSTLST